MIGKQSLELIAGQIKVKVRALKIKVKQEEKHQRLDHQGRMLQKPQS